MKIAIAQLKVLYFNRIENEKRILHFTEEALDMQVDLLLFPEAVNIGYFVLDKTKRKEEAKLLAEETATTVSSLWVNELKQKARKGLHIACGAILKTNENKLLNALMMIRPDEHIDIYCKTHPYHVREIREDFYIQTGSELNVFDTSLGKIGPSLCYDLNFPELFRTLALRDAQIILVAAAWPTVAGDSWDTLLQARAIENEIFVVACNQTGGGYYGHSKIIDYTGKILTEFNDEEGLKIAEADLSLQGKWRNTVSFFEDRRPSLYHQ